MPQASVNAQRGMRRLQNLQEVEPTLQELEKVIYGPEAAQSIVDLIRRPLEAAVRPVAGLDEGRQMLFEGATMLTPNQALARAAGIETELHRIVWHARAVLRHSVHFGTVALEDGPLGPRFVQIEPGIVHFPRLGAVSDARTAVVIGRGISLPVLLRREAKKREKSIARRREELLSLLVPSLDRVEPTAPVPTQLTSPDHPPAELMGDFVRELPGFLELMPTWRLGETIMVLDHLPRRKQADRLLAAPSSPEELNDFSL